MPTVFRQDGFRFFFYSLEHLPVHIHAENADGVCKFEIKPVRLVSNKGMKEADIKKAAEIIKQMKR